ncbi:hypothetical protein [Micromonospora fluostatini]|uniref:hypothetical protein n=1 Tax=Micromonospora sp. JCM 30529 TaxID=3421643 RepID=UPI003D17C72A
MRENGSPYWRRVTTGADGAGRAGASVAGTTPPVPAPAGAGPGTPAGTGPAPGGRRPQRFTVHLGFEATGPDEAREIAVGYAEALGLLRPELAVGASAFSPAHAWHRAERLFCGAAGPDGEHCADVAGHPGFHHAPGLAGLGWGDGD